MVILIDPIKEFTKIEHSFIIRTLNTLGRDDIHLNMMKNIYEKSTDNIIINCESLKSFSWRSRTGLRWMLSPLLFSILLEVLTGAIKEQGIKIFKNGKEIKIFLYVDNTILYIGNLKESIKQNKTKKPKTILIILWIVSSKNIFKSEVYLVLQNFTLFGNRAIENVIS